MEGRMTLCNLTIEGGARAGLIAVDDTTIEYIKGRPRAPKAGAFEQAAAYWRTLSSDADAKFDAEVTLDARDIVPMVTWGTSPEQALPITGNVPDPSGLEEHHRAAAALEEARDADLDHVARERAGEAAGHEHRDRHAEQPSRPEPVRRGGRGGDEHRQRQQVGGERDAHLGCAHAEIARHRRQRSGQHGGVEEFHEQRTGDDQRHQPIAAAGRGGGRRMGCIHAGIDFGRGFEHRCPAGPGRLPGRSGVALTAARA